MIFIEKGRQVILQCDDWALCGKTAILVDLEPVPDSTQCLVFLDGERLTISRSEISREDRSN